MPSSKITPKVAKLDETFIHFKHNIVQSYSWVMVRIRPRATFQKLRQMSPSLARHSSISSTILSYHIVGNGPTTATCPPQKNTLNVANLYETFIHFKHNTVLPYIWVMVRPRPDASLRHYAKSRQAWRLLVYMCMYFILISQKLFVVEC